MAKSTHNGTDLSFPPLNKYNDQPPISSCLLMNQDNPFLMLGFFEENPMNDRESNADKISVNQYG